MIQILGFISVALLVALGGFVVGWIDGFVCTVVIKSENELLRQRKFQLNVCKVIAPIIGIIVILRGYGNAPIQNVFAFTLIFMGGIGASAFGVYKAINRGLNKLKKA